MSARDRLASLVSLLPTPLLIFISSANTLYLKNQNELGTSLRLVTPFFERFLILLAGGLLVLALSRWRPGKLALWVYYVAGPLFVALVSLQSASFGNHFFERRFSSPAGAALWPAALLGLAMACHSRFDPRRLATPLAMLGVALALGEAWRFRTFRQQTAPSELRRVRLPDVRRPLRPNVYHILFDAAQPDLFWESLTNGTRADLGGFWFFPNNKSLYLATRTSIPSIFLGRSLPDGDLRKRLTRDAFTSSQSLLHSLKEAGYVTLAYGPRLYDFDLLLFDETVWHRENVSTAELVPLNVRTFEALWLYTHAPRWLTKRLARTRSVKHLDAEGFTLMNKSGFLPYSAPILSRLSFLKFLETEPSLPPHNRYTFVHLEIPHPPYIFRADCTYEEAEMNTHPLAQYRCANALLSEFIAVLKKHGRFEDSLIIVSGDHGSFYRAENGEAIWTAKLSLDTLLVVKPLKGTDDRELQVSTTPTTLLDIAPTVLDSLGLPSIPGLEGRSVFCELPVKSGG